MGDVIPACFPPPEATNKLASLKQKALKAHVTKPFPLIELAEFLPPWASDTPPMVEGDAVPKKSIRFAFVLCEKWVYALQCICEAGLGALGRGVPVLLSCGRCN